MILSEMAAGINTKLGRFIGGAIWVILTIISQISKVTPCGGNVILSKVGKPILFKLGMMLASPNGTKSLLRNFLIGLFFKPEKLIFHGFS